MHDLACEARKGVGHVLMSDDQFALLAHFLGGLQHMRQGNAACHHRVDHKQNLVNRMGRES
jgi:hypothetical protein